MITIHETIDINRPVAQVYDYIVNVENTQKWQPSVVEVKRITDGPVRVGTQFAEVAKMMGRRVSTTCEVTELVPNKRFAFKGTSDGPFEYETSYAFEPNGDSTRLNIAGNFRTRGVWRLLEPVIKGEVAKESQHELITMKQVIEGRGG